MLARRVSLVTFAALSTVVAVGGATSISCRSRFTDWVDTQRKNGVKVMFLTTEHSRTGTLQRELGSVRKFERLTTSELNDEFVLVRAEL
jgi:hypothetical protein